MEAIELGHVVYAVGFAIFALDVYLAFFWGKRPKKTERELGSAASEARS